MAHLHISQANWNKCGSLLDGFNTECSLENDQFPKTMTRASNVLSNHKFDKAWKEKLKKKKDKDKEKKNNWSDNDNDAKNTNNNEEQEQEKLNVSFRQQGKEITCCICGKQGHLATECSKRDTAPKSQWWSTKFKQFAQAEQDEAVEATAVAEQVPTQGSKCANKKQGWCGLQVCKETENKCCLTQQSGKDIDFNEVACLTQDQPSVQ